VTATTSNIVQAVSSKIEIDGIAVGMHLKEHARHCLPLFLFVADYISLQKITDKETAKHAMQRLKQAYFTKGSRCALYGLGEAERTWRIQRLAAEERAVDRDVQLKRQSKWFRQRRQPPRESFNGSSRASQCLSLDPILSNAHNEAAVLLHPFLPSYAVLLRRKEEMSRGRCEATAPEPNTSHANHLDQEACGDDLCRLCGWDNRGISCGDSDSSTDIDMDGNESEECTSSDSSEEEMPVAEAMLKAKEEGTWAAVRGEKQHMEGSSIRRRASPHHSGPAR
jgi:hypothetical protein